RPLFLGHRGMGAGNPIHENTLASFDQALAEACDGFEFDVRLTSDGEAVICHDARIHGMDIAKSTGHKLQSLPRLQQVIQRYCDRAFLDIELKVTGLENLVVDAVERWPTIKGFVISSFLPEVLIELSSLREDLPLGLLCETQAELAGWKNLPVAYVIPSE